MNPILQIIGYVKVICGPPHYCADLPDDVCPAIYLILQYPGQENHSNRNLHNHREYQHGYLRDFKFRWLSGHHLQRNA